MSWDAAGNELRALLHSWGWQSMNSGTASEPAAYTRSKTAEHTWIISRIPDLLIPKLGSPFRPGLLPPRALQPLVILLALEAKLVDEIRVRFQAVGQVHGERLRVHLRIVNREFDFECAKVRAADSLRHLRGVAHRTAPRVDPQFIAEAFGLNHERVAFPVRRGVTVPGRIGVFRLR